MDLGQRALVARTADVGERVRSVQRRVGQIGGDDLDWHGLAAARFRERVAERTAEIAVVADGCDRLGDRVRAHATAVDLAVDLVVDAVVGA